MYMNKSMRGGLKKMEKAAEAYEQSDTNILTDQEPYCDTHTSMMSPVELNAVPLSSLISSGRTGRTERDGQRTELMVREGK